MATSSFSVRYRPVRIGFLIRHGEIDDIVKASEINTLLWGGIYNPIIPVSKEVDFPRQLIKLFNVDILFAISHTEEIQGLLNEYEYLKSPHYFNREIFYEDWRTKKRVLGYLDVIHIIDFYWEKDFKNKSKNFRSNCVLVDWIEKDALNNLFAIVFGRFPKGLNLKYDYRKAFLKGLKAKRVLLKNEEGINGKLSQSVHPLALTRDRLQGYGGGFREHGIFIGTPNSFDDLLSFWNLRASGLDLQFLPANSKRLNSFVYQHLLLLDKMPKRNPNIEDFICVYTKDGNDAKTLLSTFKTKKNKVYCRVDKIIWNGLDIKPVSYYFDYNQVLGNVDQRFKKYSVSIALPEKPIKEDNRTFDFQDIVVVIDPITEFEYPEHTLKLPFIQELTEFYSRQIVFDPWRLRVDREGIGLIQRTSDSVINLYPIPNTKLIEKIFDFAGIQAEISQPGKLTYWIIQQMREYDPLEACRVFKIRGVRALIKGLSTERSIKWKEALRAIGSNYFDKFKQLFIESRNEPELTSQSVWNYLIKKQIFTPILSRKKGISKKEKPFHCNRCGLKSKIPYKDFSKNWICGFCGYEHYLPQFIADVFKRNEIDVWNFKKSRLFAKDNNQEGAIPVILTLLQIKRCFHESNFIYSTSLQPKRKSGSSHEITDFVVLNYGGYTIEIGIGECKSDGGSIDQDDITKLKGIKAHFENKELRCYLIFSKTADTFTKDEIELFKKLAGENIYPILFTNKELEPYEPYEEYLESNLPRQYAFTLKIWQSIQSIFILKIKIHNAGRTRVNPLLSLRTCQKPP